MAHILDEELYRAGVDLAGKPAVAGLENQVRDYLVEKLTGLPHVTTWLDEFGNLHARYLHQPEGREPVRLVAHMDHPGFVVHRGPDGVELHFRGGVEERYFVGNCVAFFSLKNNRRLGRTAITRIDFSGTIKRVWVDVDVPVEATFAVWDLPKASCTEKLFVSPACDDLVQVATMLALLRRLAAEQVPAHVEALFTRAEEVGFYGALASLQTREPLAAMVTLSLEASPAGGFAKLEAGPVLRVGDRLSIFNSRVTEWMENAFRELQKIKPATPRQRLLMAGGACEGSVFHHAGLPTGALCLAMLNYHNMGPGSAIRCEKVSLGDWQGLYDFLHFLVTQAPPVAASDQLTAARFAQLTAKALPFLHEPGVGPSLNH